jgi:hypothetical protein
LLRAPGGEDLVAEALEALTVATDAFLADGGGEVAGLDRFEVALELAFDSGDLGARRFELLLDPRPLLSRERRSVSECPLDQSAVAARPLSERVPSEPPNR